MSDRAVDRAFIALVAVILAAAVFGPTLSTLDTAFLGTDFVDHHGTQWFYWLAERSVLGDASPLHTDLFFYPWGKDVLAHTGANMLDAYLSVPFRLILGPVLGYNIFLLAGLLVSALAFAHLARQVVGDPLSIGIGAVLVGLLPYALLEAFEGRPTQALLVFPILFLAALLRVGRGDGLRAPLLAGLWLALCGYQYWYYAFFGGMVALAHGLWLTVRAAAGQRTQVLGRHAFIAAVAGLLVLPLALPLALQLDAVPGLLNVSEWGAAGTSPSVGDDMRVGLLVWEPLRAATGFYLEDPGGARLFLERTTYTPTVLLPFLLLALWRPGAAPPSFRGTFVAMCLAAGGLALGPVLIVADLGLPNLFYIGLAKLFVPLQRLWWPGRAYAFLGLLLVLALVIGLATLRSLAGPWVQRVAVLLLVGGWAWHLQREDLLPFPTWDATVPAGYRCLAHGPPGAIVELPYAWNQAHLYYQTAHGRPLLGGMIENNVLFTPPELTALRTENSFVARLINVAGGGRRDDPAIDPADRVALVDLGYRYVVLQEDALAVLSAQRSMLDNAVRSRTREMRRSLADLLGPPVWDDARVSIYALDGGGSPCEGQGIEPDRRPADRAPTRAGDLVAWEPEMLRIRWVLGGEEAGELLGDPREMLWGESKAEDGEPPP